jgi:hypothetical protein
MKHMADKYHFLAAAFRNAHGQLHEETNTPKDKKIPREKLKEAVKKGGVEAKRAQLVMNANPLSR